MQTLTDDTTRLRPALSPKAASLPASGPFEAAAPSAASDLRSALGLGLLVMYPVVATVVVVIAGVVLGGSTFAA